MIVVDASMVVKWFVAEQGHASALQLLDPTHVLIAPDLVFPETANVLWKKFRRGELSREQCARACSALPEFFQGIVTSASLIAEAFELATQLNHSVCDCIYLACAKEHGAKLFTADTRLMSHVKAAGLSHFAVSPDEMSDVNQALLALSISDAELTRVLGLGDRYNRTLNFVEEQVGKTIAGGTLK